MKKSIYTQLVLSFILIFLLSNILASTLAFFGTEINTLDKLEDQLVENLNIIKEEFNNIEPTQIEKLTKNNYITVQVKDHLKNFNLNKEIKQRIQDGEAVNLSTDQHGDNNINAPIAIAKIDEKFIIVKPDFDNLGFSARDIIFVINIVAVFIGGISYIYIGRLIVRPIQSLKQATNEISKGNFDIDVKINRKDEIGDLIISFNAMAMELNSIEILRNNFISDISHEFKTPLTSIEGYTKLLEDCSEPERKEYIAVILEETNRLSVLASNILSLNHIESQKIINLNDAFFLDEQIRKAIVLLSPSWDKKNIDFQINLEQIKYIGNSEMMYQVWINLIENAIKFSDNESQIIINLTQNAEEIIFEIEDFGPGIEPEDYDKIFEKFYQSDLSRRNEGNGLGLSIVKRIVEMHQGTITVDSKIGQNTTFKIKLRVNDPQEKGKGISY